MAYKDHIHEEKLIDYLLGKTQTENAQIESHLKQCKECSETVKYWHEILMDGEITPVPPELKEKIWAQLSKKRKYDKRWSRPKLILRAASFAAVVCMIVAITFLNNHFTKTNQYTLDEKTKEEQFVVLPATKQINIVPTSNYNSINGNIWINDETKEILIKLDGLERFDHQDYQLWMIYIDDDLEGELLPIKNGSSKIFFQNKNTHELKQIKASIEPKGGSMFPTGPEPFNVRIHED